MGRILFILTAAPILLALNTQGTGHRVDRSTTKAINAHNVCKKVVNANATKDFFVPTKSAAEWTAFRSNLPAGVTLGNCTSCLDILNNNGSEGDGVYYIDPSGSSPYPVYCDMTTSGGGWTLVAYSNGTATATTPNDFFVNSYNAAQAPNHTIPNQQASINAEAFSIAVNSTDAMFVSPSYNAGAPIIDLAGGNWNYNNTKCAGNLRHTSRTAGCAGQNANDGYNGADAFNIAVNSGNEGIVPAHKAIEICYSGKGNACSFKFYLR